MSDITLDTKKLGFGLMRLPKKGLGIDIPQTCEMVDAFLASGGTYFDTAHVYPGSEDAVRKALTSRHPRENYTIATKLYASAMPTEKMAKNQLETSLKRMQTDYIDYYLLHTLTAGNKKKYDKFGLWDFVREQKEKGVIRHYGFSFHDGPELLDQLLTEHPDVEFVQLQINYADWENPTVASRANYEVARKHGKPIIVMEPGKGGTLANPPAEIQKLFKEKHPDMSYASWAIRFVASLDGIKAVLSGMSNMDQMRDNLSYMEDFKPLDEEELAIIHEAQQIMGKSKMIPCTSCHYCTGGCPMEIPIPEIFTAMNKRLGSGQIEGSVEAYKQVTDDGHLASSCIQCGQCESACPQHIEVIKRLAECAEALEA